jgi:hypothetical protein
VPERKYFTGSAKIIDLARVRAARTQARRPRRTARSPGFILSVGLVCGIGLGVLVTRFQAGTAWMERQHGSLRATGELLRALNAQAAGATADSVVHVTATYRGRSSNYCRTFNVSGTAPLSGIACRNGGQWAVDAVSDAGGGMASSDLGHWVIGPPLTSAAEIQLRTHDWQ